MAVDQMTVGGTPVQQDTTLQPIGTEQMSAQGRPEGNVPDLGGIGVQAPEYAWQVNNSDLFPAGTQLTRERTAWGDPINVAGPSVIPWSVIANRQQQNANDRRKLEAEMRSWDPYKDMPEVSPAYSDSFQKTYMDRTQRRIREAVDAYGGDYNLAYRDLNNPASPLGHQFRREQLALLTIARKANSVTDSAMNTIDAMEKGEAEVDPLVYQQGKRVLSGAEYSGDVIQLADDMEQFEAVQNFSKFLKEKGLMQALMAAKFGQDVAVPGKRDRNGKIIYETITQADPNARQRILDAAYAQVPIFYRNMWGEQGVKDRLDAYLTMDEESKRQIEEPWHGFAPREGDKDTRAVVGGPERRSMGQSTMDLSGSAPMEQVIGRQNYDATSFPIAQGGNAVSGTWRLTNRTKDGEEVTEIKPKDFVVINGETFVRGEYAGNEDKVTTKTEQKDKSGNVIGVKETTTSTKSLTDFLVPVKGNEATLDQYAANWREQVGYGTAPVIDSQEAYDALPVGARYKTADGRELTKK